MSMILISKWRVHSSNAVTGLETSLLSPWATSILFRQTWFFEKLYFSMFQYLKRRISSTLNFAIDFSEYLWTSLGEFYRLAEFRRARQMFKPDFLGNEIPNGRLILYIANLVFLTNFVIRVFLKEGFKWEMFSQCPTRLFRNRLQRAANGDPTAVARFARRCHVYRSRGFLPPSNMLYTFILKNIHTSILFVSKVVHSLFAEKYQYSQEGSHFKPRNTTPIYTDEQIRIPRIPFRTDNFEIPKDTVDISWIMVQLEKKRGS